MIRCLTRDELTDEEVEFIIERVNLQLHTPVQLDNQLI